MSKIKAYPKTESQINLLKLLLEELKINFEISNEEENEIPNISKDEISLDKSVEDEMKKY